MNIITQESLNTASYVFIVMVGIATFLGAIVVYFDKKTRYSKKRKYKK